MKSLLLVTLTILSTFSTTTAFFENWNFLNPLNWWKTAGGKIDKTNFFTFLVWSIDFNALPVVLSSLS